MTWWNWRADLALGLDAVRPVDDRAVAGAAPVRGDLLGPLVGRVHRVRPADRVVVVGLGPAEVVDLATSGTRASRVPHAVERRHLVEAAVERALGRGAVVADDVVDQRVVEDLQVLRARRPAGRRGGRCAPGSRRRPPSGGRRPACIFSGMSSQAGISSGRAVSSASAGMTPSFFWRANVSSRSLSQPWSNLPLYFSIHSFGTWCGAWRRAGREVHEERLVGHQRLLLADPLIALFGHVLGEVVALLGRLLAARSASCLRRSPGTTGWSRRR